MQKAISKYWPVFVLPTLLAFIIGFIWPFILRSRHRRLERRCDRFRRWLG